MPTTTDRRPTDPRAEIRAYVALLTGSPQRGELLELRSRLPTGGMARRFYPAARPSGLVEAIGRLGRRGDVYVGCAPRTRRSGGRDAIARSWVLWAECDTPAARTALEAFAPAPTLIIASGSPHGRHAYWALAQPIAVDALENANRRLADQLAADPACVDAARILRPPGTLNFKRDLLTDVVTVEHRPERRYELDDLLRHLPEPRSTPVCAAAVDRVRDGDPLLAIAPDEYVPVLLGQAIRRDRKVNCPFHTDTTPSLHAYPDHWFCFGCQTGGTIYDLAARLWQLDTRDHDFLELRDRLQAAFNTTPPP